MICNWNKIHFQMFWRYDFSEVLKLLRFGSVRRFTDKLFHCLAPSAVNDFSFKIASSRIWHSEKLIINRM